jgi:hypothetical protein
VGKYARIVSFGGCFAISLTLPTPAVAQVASGTADSSSCRGFVQQFYDWYVPFAQTTIKGRASDLALRHKAEVFSPALLGALKVDSDASARAKGEIVGIDFDPFVGGQDPADHYGARRVTRRDNKCSAEIWRASPTDTVAKSGKPDVIADVVLDRGVGNSSISDTRM